MTLLFLLSVCAAIYSYFFYPLILLLFPKKRSGYAYQLLNIKKIAVIIAVRNEAAKIAHKIENTLALEFRDFDVEVIVASDASDDATDVVERIHKGVLEEMEENTRLAEKEWKRGTRGDGLSQFSAEPVVSLRPTASGIEAEVRYITRASERFDVRNRLNQRLIDLLHVQPGPVPAA